MKTNLVVIRISPKHIFIPVIWLIHLQIENITLYINVFDLCDTLWIGKTLDTLPKRILFKYM